MKTLTEFRWLIAIALFSLTATAPGSRIIVAPARGVLEQGHTSIRVTFPTPMVELEAIGRDGQPSPILFEPTAEVSWKWVSQLEGKLTIPALFLKDNVPGAEVPAAELFRIRRQAKLRAGLKDLDGAAVGSANWGMEFADDEFAVSGVQFLNVPESEQNPRKEEDDEDLPQEEGEQQSPGESSEDASREKNHEIERRDLDDPLPALPRVRLEFTRDVSPRSLVGAVFFQTSNGAERFPIEVNLEQRQPDAPQGWVVIEPAKPLPAGKTFTLVINRITEVNQATLPNMLVLPAGTTYVPEIRGVGGFHQPGKGAFVRVQANQTIDDDLANLKLITVRPEPRNLRRLAAGNSVELLGDFTADAEYDVTVEAGLKTEEGFSMGTTRTYKTKILPKRPAIVFAEEHVFRRASATPVRVPFTQVNTQELEWCVARIPRDKLADVRKRLREFEDFVYEKDGSLSRHPVTRAPLRKPTELLVRALMLPVVASGKVAASGDDKEVARTVEWTPADGNPGIFLVEVWGRDLRNRQVGNRTILSRGDWLVTQVESADGLIVQVRDMSTALPVPMLPVSRFSYSGVEAGELHTDANGEVVFRGEVGSDFLIGRRDAEFLQLGSMPPFASGEHVGTVPDEDIPNPSVIVTDRAIYRPGETVKFKGFIRRASENGLVIPAGEKIVWEIAHNLITDAPIHSTEAVISANGGFEGEWKSPPTMYGDYFIRVTDAATAKITISEFRPPSFSAIVQTEDVQGDTVVANVSSTYFHGAPNAQAKVRWRAEWLVDDWRRDHPLASEIEFGRDTAQRALLVLDDEHSPEAQAQGYGLTPSEEMVKAGWEEMPREDRAVTTAVTARGVDTLDQNGTRRIVCKAPFPPSTVIGRAKVFWIVDITSAAAETVRGGAVAKAQLVPNILGVNLETAADQKLTVQVGSFDAKDQPSADLAAKAELLRVDTKIAKEQLAPGLHRYRNTPTYTPVWSEEIVTPATRAIKVDQPGDYVVRVTAPKQPATPQVSDMTTVWGTGHADVSVDTESSLFCKMERPLYRAGETAAVTIRTPITGVATLTVETDRVLHRQQVQLKGNAERVSFPVLPSFAPNAYVAVHLVKPAVGDQLPAERFGFCPIKVERDDLRLEVVPKLARTTVEPGEKASGVVTVSAARKPVAGAEVLLFAVDEAVLQLGRWRLPDFAAAFFPPRPWHVVTYSALGRHWAPEQPKDLTHGQKGFIMGDAGPAVTNMTFRKGLKTLAFWNAQMRTNQNGEVPFEFEAPDGLTTFRVVAVAQNAADQFGNGHAALQINKRVQVEPKLPDFMRQGDEILLRTVVRQDHAASDELQVSVIPDKNVQLAEPASKRLRLSKGEGGIVAFRATVAPHATSTTIKFAAASVSNPALTDGKQHIANVYPPAIERREAIAGTLSANDSLDIGVIAKREWLQGSGRCDVLLSGSRFLPKLAGLPAVLNAQGSTEKLATRLLAATVLEDALKYLPGEQSGADRPKTELIRGLKRLAQCSFGAEGLPAWPDTEKRNVQFDAFSTIQAAWAVRHAARRAMPIDERLRRHAELWLSEIVAQRGGFANVPASLRCFAYMVLGNTRDPAEEFPSTFEHEAEQLYQNRKDLSVEGMAWLALGMHYFGINPAAVSDLLTTLASSPLPTSFDPATFGSKTRAEAIRLLAQSEITSTKWLAAQRQRALKTFDTIAQSSIDLSTQENLWLLLLFESLARSESPALLSKKPLTPKPTAVSANNFTVGWLNLPLEKLGSTFAQPVKSGVAGTYLIRATYQSPERSAPPPNPNLNLRRSFRNLSDSRRTGEEAAPLKLGDEILVTYEITADMPHSHLELEDQLPTCFETVNSNLREISRHYELAPPEAGVKALTLSNHELRFARTLFYFAEAAPGRSLYSTTARVTAAGKFVWPATQVRPMYDSRFLGMTESGVLHVAP